MFQAKRPLSRLDEPASAEDVRAAYRFLLDREVESDETLARYLDSKPTLETVLRSIMGSEEALRRTLSPLGHMFSFGDWDDSKVEVLCSPEKLDRLLDLVRTAWTRLGQTEAFFSVITDPRFARKQMTPEREAEFYATGSVEVAAAERICHRNGVSFGTGSVLDFGCGLGRLGEHLSARFERYTGVDISAAHLQGAADRFRRIGRSNTELLLLGNYLAAAERRWDCIVSFLVIQHNPPPVMRWMLLELLRRLAPGGTALIQLPVQQFDYRFDVNAYLSGGGERDMEMHVLPQRHVFATAAEAGCEVREVFADGKVGPIGLSYNFLFTRPPAA